MGARGVIEVDGVEEVDWEQRLKWVNGNRSADPPNCTAKR